jgi:hypothetical protein
MNDSGSDRLTGTIRITLALATRPWRRPSLF